MKTFLKSAQNQSLSSEICSGSSHEIGRSFYQSFFSETGLENSREIPAKSAVFSATLPLKIPRNLTFFFRDLPEALFRLQWVRNTSYQLRYLSYLERRYLQSFIHLAIAINPVGHYACPSNVDAVM